jgi:hypothetical protein
MTDSLNPWEEMVLEVLEAAQQRLHKKDFDRQCKMILPGNGKSYFDRVKVYDQLILDKVIEIDNGTMTISNRDIPPWLFDGLKKGTVASWKIFEKINPTSKYADKVDRLLLEEIGLAGEEAVVTILKKSLPHELHNKVKHISLFDDSAGFDIQTPSIKDNTETLFLEIKTSTRPGSIFNFYISRNETRVASLNRNWLLVAISKRDGDHEIIGTLFYDQFSSFLPTNSHPDGRWENCKISIPVSLFENGLP